MKINSKRLPTWLATPLRSGLNRLLGFSKLNELYCRLPEHEDHEFSKTVLDAMNVTLDVSGEPLSFYPVTGPQIFVSNHPHGLIDGLAVDHLVRSLRPNARIMSMYVLGEIPELQKTLIPVDPLRSRKRYAMNLSGWHKSHEHVSGGGALVVFPAGGVSRFDWDKKKITDLKWNRHVASLARRTGATVVPMFIHGRGGLVFQIAGLISGALQNLALFNELPKMRNRTLQVTFGKPLPPEGWSHIPDDKLLIEHFRERVESLAKKP